MRAAMTYAFSHIHGLGMLAWHSDAFTQQMAGNPSMANAITSYMLSLKNRKASLPLLCPLALSDFCCCDCTLGARG